MGKSVMDKVCEAIDCFVENNGECQHSITLPYWYYRRLLKEANSTDLGRNFVANGLCLFQLPVLCGGWRIVINPEPARCDIYNKIQAC